jgi:hypothetical protein
LEKRIKDMEKTIHKLVSNLSFEESDLKVFKELVEALQESIKANKTFDTLREENYELKAATKDF